LDPQLSWDPFGQGRPLRGNVGWLDIILADREVWVVITLLIVVALLSVAGVPFLRRWQPRLVAHADRQDAKAAAAARPKPGCITVTLAEQTFERRLDRAVVIVRIKNASDHDVHVHDVVLDVRQDGNFGVDGWVPTGDAGIVEAGRSDFVEATLSADAVDRRGFPLFVILAAIRMSKPKGPKVKEEPNCSIGRIEGWKP
jgi:hypothetical protein